LSIFGKIRDWFRGSPTDPETEAAARKLHDDQATVRVSQTGSASPMMGGAPASANIPPTPDVLDPDAGDR
jgi:hypothetical protein